jgi:hypothetical protein
VGGGA